MSFGHGLHPSSRTSRPHTSDVTYSCSSPARRDAEVYVEQDMGTMTEFIGATGAMQKSITEWQTLCPG